MAAPLAGLASTERRERPRVPRWIIITLVSLACLVTLLSPALMVASDDSAAIVAGGVLMPTADAVQRALAQQSCSALGETTMADLSERTDIPMEALSAYCKAATTYDMDWAVLAGVGKMECDHGRSLLPGCDMRCDPALPQGAGCKPRLTINEAGARGPMQFLGSTWRNSAGQFDLDVSGPPIAEGAGGGMATDGNADGVADPWTWDDAAHAGARYLVRAGVRESDSLAAFRYFNGPNATWDPTHFYHQGVLRHANTYRQATMQVTPGPTGDVTLATVEGITVHTSIANAVGRMVRDARSQGVRLTGGGYRSHQQQIDLRRAHCGPTHYDIYEKPSSECSPPTATPGRSNHERGLAIDFHNCGSHGTACWRWLNTHAAAYGFYNLPSEPWHWSIDGR